MISSGSSGQGGCFSADQLGLPKVCRFMRDWGAFFLRTPKQRDGRVPHRRDVFGTGESFPVALFPGAFGMRRASAETAISDLVSERKVSFLDEGVGRVNLGLIPPSTS